MTSQVAANRGPLLGRQRFPGRLKVVIAVVAATSAMTVGPLTANADASSSPSLSTFDTHLLRDINAARSARGIRKLTVVAGTTDVAHHWACHLASSSALSHDLDLASALETHGSQLWTAYGENVGFETTAYTAAHLFHSYMHDPAHRANILDPSFRYVGIWTKRHNGRRWNTIDFVGSPISSYSSAYGATRVTC